MTPADEVLTSELLFTQVPDVPDVWTCGPYIVTRLASGWWEAAHDGEVFDHLRTERGALEACRVHHRNLESPL